MNPGQGRCTWCGDDPLYVDYHDVEWGVPIRDDKDLYIQGLRKEIRTGAEPYFLDRLLVAGIVEARGCERFGRVAEALDPGKLRDFYQDIARSESQHHGLFYRLARQYFDTGEVEARQHTLLDREAEIVANLPIRPAVH